MSTAGVIAIAIAVVVVLAAVSFLTLARRSDVRGAGALSGETLRATVRRVDTSRRLPSAPLRSPRPRGPPPAGRRSRRSTRHPPSSRGRRPIPRPSGSRVGSSSTVPRSRS